MQINGPSFLPSPMRPTQAAARSNAFTVTAPTPQALPPAATNPPLGGPAQQPIDVATILQNWGTSNPLADLNTDGIVDAADLALASEQQNAGTSGVLANWGSGGASDLNGDGAVDAQDLAAALSGTQGANDGSSNASSWQSAAGGDHNGDGTIDATDLAMSLSAQQSGAAGATGPVEPVDPTPMQLVENLVDQAFATRDADRDGALGAADFPDGTKIFARLDLDDSGSVQRDELTKALLADFSRFREQFPGAAPAAFARRWGDAFAGTHPVPNPAGFARAAQAFSNPAALAMNATRGILSALA